jgi:Leucine-rich repeat (LRR) protein
VRHLLPLFAILLYLAPTADALSADLNRDGIVDFDDFLCSPISSASPASPTRRTRSSSFRDTLALIDTVYIDPADTVTRVGTPITFADPAVEFAVRDLVGVAQGDLLTGDVDGITVLDLSGLNISLLDGLQHFTSLTTLSLTDNLIVDLSPLQGLSNLQAVTLATNEVRDIEPLVDNPALATGSSVILAGNPLSVLSRTTYVTTMQDRGAYRHRRRLR